MSASPATLANRIYTVLVNEAGAVNSVSDRMQFKRFFEEAQHFDEYRFMGLLGFGGKFWIQPGRWFVNCYGEDETPQRLEIISRTNAALDALAGSGAPGRGATPE